MRDSTVATRELKAYKVIVANPLWLTLEIKLNSTMSKDNFLLCLNWKLTNLHQICS